MSRGRNSAWIGPTKMIRLPAAHEEALREVAHKLEAGEAWISDSETQTAAQALLQEAISRTLMQLRASKRREALPWFKRLEKTLANLQLTTDKPNQGQAVGSSQQGPADKTD